MVLKEKESGRRGRRQQSNKKEKGRERKKKEVHEWKEGGEMEGREGEKVGERKRGQK